MTTPAIATTPAPNALDLRGLADIQRQARSNDPAALKAVARQFEALFLQMVLKSMRDATPQEGLFDSEQTRMYQSLLDQQLSQVLSSGKGGLGLAAVIERQLARESATPAEAGESTGFDLQPLLRQLRLRRDGLPLNNPAPDSGAAAPAAVPPGLTFEATQSLPTNAQAFVARVLPDAEAASRQTGVPAVFLIAHAALETGWGRGEPRDAAGKPSHNLFGIKAGAGWQGDSVEATTTEYVAGVAQRRVERFRAYGSYAESFRDYASLLVNNPRYAATLKATDAASFSSALQKAGYATDPTYAGKLTRIIAQLS